MTELAIVPDKRFPPSTYDLEAEQAALACCLLNLAALARVCSEVQPGWFAGPLNQAIFEAIRVLWERGIEPDRVTILGQLRTQGVEGRDVVLYIGELTAFHPLVTDVGAYIRLIYEHALRRALGTAGKGLVNRALDPQKDPFETLAWLARIPSELAPDLGTSRGLDELAVARAKAIADAASGTANHPLWPLPKLAKALAPLRGGRFHVIVGYSGFGKSTLALQQADVTALGGVPAVVFPLEMTPEECLGRICRFATGYDALNAERYVLPEDDFEGWRETRRIVPLYFSAQRTYEAISAEIRRLVVTKGIKLAVVDYLGLVQGGNDRWSPAHRMAAIANGFKALALDLKIDITTPVQITKEGKAAERIERYHIKETGGIEDAADTILILNRKPDHKPRPGESFLFDCDIAKQRSGGSGLSVELRWDSRRVMITNGGEE